MYLERLDIHGFKSFAKKTTLLFEARPHTRPGITSIVGPNGSGKSNIADAIRWVLGETSAKAVRGKKMEDVIFSGSQKKARLGMAEVTLTLNNEDRKSPIEANQISLTRRAFRDGHSEYRVNDQSARLQDVQLLLAQSHFGQRTYSVIGQGMVDAILLSSPKERKEYFDEAVGVKQYQLKREETVRKLDAARMNVHEVEIVLQEIGPRLRSLTRQVKRLERREEVEKELRRVQEKYYASLWHDIVQELKAKRGVLARVSRDREEKQKAVADIQKALASLEKQETQSEAFLALQREYEQLIAKRAAVREKEFQLKSELVRAEGRAHVKGALPPAELSAFVEKIIATHETLLSKVLSATTAETLEELKPALRELSGEIRQFAKRMKGGSSDAEETKGRLEKELQLLLRDVEGIGEQINQVQEQLREVGKKEQEKKSSFFALQRSFQEKQQSLNTITQEENDLKIALARLEQRQEDLEREMRAEHPELITSVARMSEGRMPVDAARALLPEMSQMKKQLELIGGIDPEAVSEYHKIKERHDFLSGQMNDLNATIESLEGAIQELDATIKQQFETAFHTINEEFEKFFKILFGGGKATLVLVKDLPPEELPIEADNAEKADNAEDDDDEEKERPMPKKSALKPIVVGIDVHATPPGKKLRNISMLSGGERALTSIALISSFIAFNPSPFVVLDEVDAALDEANSGRFARIIDELSNRTQFITITHNRATMQQSAVLYGVTMGDDGISNILSVKFDEEKKDVTPSPHRRG